MFVNETLFVFANAFEIVHRGRRQVEGSEHLSVGYQMELDWFHMPLGVRPIFL